MSPSYAVDLEWHLGYRLAQLLQTMLRILQNVPKKSVVNTLKSVSAACDDAFKKYFTFFYRFPQLSQLLCMSKKFNLP